GRRDSRREDSRPPPGVAYAPRLRRRLRLDGHDPGLRLAPVGPADLHLARPSPPLRIRWALRRPAPQHARVVRPTPYGPSHGATDFPGRARPRLHERRRGERPESGPAEP